MPTLRCTGRDCARRAPCTRDERSVARVCAPAWAAGHGWDCWTQVPWLGGGRPAGVHRPTPKALKARNGDWRVWMETPLCIFFYYFLRFGGQATCMGPWARYVRGTASLRRGVGCPSAENLLRYLLMGPWARGVMTEDVAAREPLASRLKPERTEGRLNLKSQAVRS